MDPTTTTETRSVVGNDRVLEKLLKKKSSEKFLKPFLLEFSRMIRPYMWMLVGVYLSLILPIMILMVLLIVAYGHILQLCEGRMSPRNIL